ncbi:perlucin-like protein [Mya arenaria]|uniref:perlucin-like protein n=1 Tax=Mya arenaria TaxID=6604 RepID=UPI0022E4B751|nr:perlucin-like protein [Mya arenaria]
MVKTSRMDRRFVAFVVLMFQCVSCAYTSSCERCYFEDKVLNDLQVIKETIEGICSSSPTSTTDSSTTSTTTSATPSCLSDWVNFNESCYFFNTVPLSFLDAERACQERNAHLVHINDASENAFVKAHARLTRYDYWWIGLTDIFQEGVWRWIDDWTPADYLDWLTGGPNSASERCGDLLYFENFDWNDATCGYSLLSICEKRL